jgi:hypothetical protein
MCKRYVCTVLSIVVCTNFPNQLAIYILMMLVRNVEQFTVLLMLMKGLHRVKLDKKRTFQHIAWWGVFRVALKIIILDLEKTACACCILKLWCNITLNIHKLWENYTQIRCPFYCSFVRCKGKKLFCSDDCRSWPREEKINNNGCWGKHAHIPDNDYWGICLFHVVWTNFVLQLFLCIFT